MNDIITFLQSPWPWYISGPLIGLTVPLLLWLGNKSFGISSNLRHLCAIALPASARPTFFRYNWRAEQWNLVFGVGLLLGGFLGGFIFANPEPIQLSVATQQSLAELGITQHPGLVPTELEQLSNPKVWLLLALGGILVGFGTRYGGGCTSGHAITGLSTLQVPSLIATISFFIGGILSAHFLLPLFLRWIL